MLRYLCCLWPQSQPIPRRAEEIEDDLRGSLAQRRQLAEKIVEEGEVRAELALMLDGLKEEFERRVKVARLGSGLTEDTDEELCRKCWSGEQYPWYGPSPADVFLALRGSQHRFTIRHKSLDAVHQRVCSLQDEFAEAAKRENPDLQFGREQLDAEVFLPPEPLETIDQVHYSTVPISTEPSDDDDSGAKIDALLSAEPKVIDWDAKMDAARQKFKASSARVRQAVEQFDLLLIEPMREKDRNHVMPAQVSCIQDERAQDRMCPQLHIAHKKATPALILPEESQDVIAVVEYATASISVVTPVEYAGASDIVSATVEHATATEQNVIDWDARLDAARQKVRASAMRIRQSFERYDQALPETESESLKRMTSSGACEQPDSA